MTADPLARSADLLARSADLLARSADLLAAEPANAVVLAGLLDVSTLHHMAEAIADEVRRRAVADGDADAVIADAFETGFGRDGLGTLPWINGSFVVCPGGLIAKSRSAHRCRFVSVDDTWVWDSNELIREEKRSTPGPTDGFVAVALLPVVEGMALDVVSGRLRGGRHQVDRVVSLEVHGGELIEVAQRKVSAAGLQ